MSLWCGCLPLVWVVWCWLRASLGRWLLVLRRRVGLGAIQPQIESKLCHCFRGSQPLKGSNLCRWLGGSQPQIVLKNKAVSRAVSCTVKQNCAIVLGAISRRLNQHRATVAGAVGRRLNQNSAAGLRAVGRRLHATCVRNPMEPTQRYSQALRHVVESPMVKQERTSTSPGSPPPLGHPPPAI